MNLYTKLARGGVGLIITGDAFVTRTGQTTPGQLGIYDDSLTEDLKSLVDAVHRERGRIVVQINHAGRQAPPEINDGAQPVAPSPVPLGEGKILPRELSGSEISEMAQAYGFSARRARKAGFDGVQLHGAHGNLISQFLSPHTNRRSDSWSGDFEKRLRFLEAVCKAVRSEVGQDYPLLIKLASQDYVERGLTPEDGTRIASRLGDFGINAIEVSGGIQEGCHQWSANIRSGVRSESAEAYFLDNARRMRVVSSLPLMLVGGLRSKSVMERVVEEDGMDFVSMCRPLINDPQLPNKLRSGQAERATCISCNLCLEKGDQPIRCWYALGNERGR